MARLEQRRLLLLMLVSLPLLADESKTAQMNPPDIGLAADPAPGEVTGGLREGSHVKLFLPNLPYLAISHTINGSLVRPCPSRIFMQPSEDTHGEGRGRLGIQQRCRIPLLVLDDRPVYSYK